MINSHASIVKGFFLHLQMQHLQLPSISKRRIAAASVRTTGGAPGRKPALVDTNSERRSTPELASICRACPTLSSPRPFLQAPSNLPRLELQAVSLSPDISYITQEYPRQYNRTLLAVKASKGADVRVLSSR